MRTPTSNWSPCGGWPGHIRTSTPLIHPVPVGAISHTVPPKRRSPALARALISPLLPTSLHVELRALLRATPSPSPTSPVGVTLETTSTEALLVPVKQNKLTALLETTKLTGESGVTARNRTISCGGSGREFSAGEKEATVCIEAWLWTGSF